MLVGLVGAAAACMLLTMHRHTGCWLAPSLIPQPQQWQNQQRCWQSRRPCYLNPARFRKPGARTLVKLYVNAESATATSTPASKLPAPTRTKTLVAVSSFIILDVIFRHSFSRMAISFPSSLAGCGVLFASLITLPKGEKLFQFLDPGAALLAKWLPLFFVPTLVTLPLAPGFGSASEFVKVLAVIVGGFVFTLLTTAWSVVLARKLSQTAQQPPVTEPEVSLDQPTKHIPPAKPFSDKLDSRLRLLACVSGMAAVLVIRLGVSDTVSTPVYSLFMLLTTMSAFVFGARLPKRFTKVIHPIVTCTSLTCLILMAFGKLIGETFESCLKCYRVGHIGLMGGAGDILLFLLGPAVVSLACSMYARRKLMQNNVLEVGSAITVSTFGGVFATAAAVRLLNIGSPSLRLTLLSRNITSPLAMSVAGMLGADTSLAVSIVVVTGLLGAISGARILDSFGIKDAVARGLGIGAAAHGIGTAAFVNEKDAFPFAAIAMALTGAATTVVISVPLLRRAIVKLALG